MTKIMLSFICRLLLRKAGIEPILLVRNGSEGERRLHSAPGHLMLVCALESASHMRCHYATSFATRSLRLFPKEKFLEEIQFSRFTQTTMHVRFSATTSFLTLISFAIAHTIPSSVNQLAQPHPSSTLSVGNPHPSVVGIDSSVHPDWAGELNPPDCVKAYQLFEEKVRTYPQARRVTFWSLQWSRVQPQGVTFRLPYSVEYGKSGLSPFRRAPAPYRGTQPLQTPAA